MAQSLNKCSFIGNLGGDPEVRYLPSGDALCNFTIACTDSWKDKQSGEMKEKTEWVRISAFGKLAEICGEYLKKGAKVYCEGKFTTRKYQAADGTDRYATEIKLENMIMLGSRQTGDGDGEHRERNTNAGNGQQRQQQNRSSAPPSGQRAGSAGTRHHGGGPAGGFDEMDDDIPFAPIYRGMQWHSVA